MIMIARRRIRCPSECNLTQISLNSLSHPVNHCPDGAPDGVFLFLVLPRLKEKDWVLAQKSKMLVCGIKDAK